MKKPKNSFLFHKLGVSYTISAVIMTVTAITLTLVAASYAYQILEQQRGATEFDAARESILAFNDALENIAWKPGASGSARFTVHYGQLDLIPNMRLTVNVTGGPPGDFSISREFSTGYLSYGTKTRYVSFEEDYRSYFLGNESTLSTGAGSYGRGSLEQKSGWVSMTLMYGVRVMKASTIETNQGTVDNVDIWIIETNVIKRSTNIGEFDLKARCLNVTTIPYADGGNGYPVPEDGQCNIAVGLGKDTSDTFIQLEGDNVVFNFVVATVQVTV